MKAETRRAFAIERLAQKRFVSIREITDRFDVSGMTARRDLAHLADEGYAVRTHGGAIKTEKANGLFSFRSRVESKSVQKEALCRAAAGYIRDHETVFIDCGTTLFRLCSFMGEFEDLRVITNSLPVVSELMDRSGIRVNMTGGEVYADRRAVYGELAQRTLSGVHADKAFVGADGISLARGLSSFDEAEAVITKCMIEESDRVYVLCDSSKIERDSYMGMGALDLVDFLITDDGMNDEMARNYAEAGIEVIRVETKTKEKQE